MTLSEYIETLLWDNFGVKEGEPIRWYVLAAAFVTSRATERVIERVSKILRVDETELREKLREDDPDKDLPYYDCGGKRCRYYGEISNTALARVLGVPYIGNKEFIRAADEAGIAWTYHGTHPYIRESLKDELVKHLQLSKKTETDI